MSYKVGKSETLHLYCNGSVISSGRLSGKADMLISELYEREKDKSDNFLYLCIGNSEAFG